MNWVFISLIVTTVGQGVLLGFSFPLLLSTIGRLLFLTRIVGAVIKIKVSLGFELAGLFLIALKVVFTAGNVDWSSTLLFCLFDLVAYGLMWLDDKMYLYVTLDKED